MEQISATPRPCHHNRFPSRLVRRSPPSRTPSSPEQISQPQTTFMNWRWVGLWRQDWILSLLLVVIRMAAYLPAWHGRPIWDDDAHLTKPELRSLGGLVRIWTQPGATQQYYPLVHSLFWAEHQLWGDCVRIPL